MEKIKNLLNPGRTQDNETLYGSGTNTGATGATGGLKGEGSHLSSNTGNTSGLPGSQTTGTSGIGHSSTGVPSDGSHAQTGHGIGSHSGTGTSGHSAETSGLTGQGSHPAGASSGTTSGLTGNHTSGLGNSSNTTGTGQSSIGRDAAVAGGSTGFAHHGGPQHGSGRELGTETANPAVQGHSGLPSSTTHSSHMPGSWDDTYDRGSGNKGLTGTNASTGLRSNPVHPSTTQGTNQYASSGLPQSGNSGQHLGRDAGVLGTAGAVGQGIHHHGEQDRQPGHQDYSGRSMPLSSSGAHTQTSGSQPLGSNTGYGNTQSGNNNSGHLGRDAAAIGTAGAVGEGIHHHRENERGLGSSGVTSGSTTYGSSGPHSTNTANLLDPYVSGGARNLEDAHEHHPRHGGGAEAADQHHIAQSSTTTGSGHLGRNAAIGAGGVGLAEHEHNKHHNDRSTGVGGNTGINQPTTASSASHMNPTSTSTGRDHHSGRDAAAVGGAGALGEHEYRKHEVASGQHSELTGTNQYDNTSGLAGSQGQSSHHLGRDAGVGGGLGAAGLSAREHRKHDDNVGAKVGPPDEVIGTGGVGAAGLAGREYEKTHGDNTMSTGNTSGLTHSGSGTSSLPGPAPNTAGPHSKDWMNKLDPRVDTNPTMAQGNPQAESALSSHNQSGGSSSDHHYGRDAAIAGGVGTAAYGADKHHSGKHDVQDSHQPGHTGASTTSGSQHPFSTTGNDAHRVDPTTDREHSKDHHYGRDAAIAGGVGGAAYEADQHHKHDKDLSQAERDAKKQHKHDEKEFKKEHRHDAYEKDAKKDSKGGILGFLHRDKNKKYTAEEEAEFDRQEREHNSSHKGRDAALGTAGVGTLGAGAYGAEKYHGQHTSAEIEKPLPYAPGNHGVGTGPGAQNALAGDNTTSGQSGHHYGRDAALGAGIAGGAGYASHEHNKHQGTAPLSEKPVGQDLGDKLHGTERNRGVPGSSGLPDSEGYGRGTGIHSEASTDQYGNPVGLGTHTGSQGHHLGRDAALGAGAVGIGAHEHNKHNAQYQQGTPGYNNTTSSALTGSQQGQHQYGRDTATAGGVGGAGALGEHEYRQHEGTGQHAGSNPAGLSGQSSQYGNTSSGLTGSQGQTSHHYGRDAAVGGAGALGEHEYRKHEGASGQHSGLTSGQHSGLTGTNQYDNTSSGLAGSQGQSTAGGAGALGQHEYRKHDNATGQHLAGSNNQYDNASAGAGYGQQQTGNTGSGSQYVDPEIDGRKGPSVVAGDDGRHRLHKDPPASHPASGISQIPLRERFDGDSAHPGNERTGY